MQRKAKAEHRSIAQETVVLLRKALEQTESPSAERLAALNRLEKTKLEDIPGFPSSDTIIREDRDR